MYTRRKIKYTRHKMWERNITIRMSVSHSVSGYECNPPGLNTIAPGDCHYKTNTVFPNTGELPLQTNTVFPNTGGIAITKQTRCSRIPGDCHRKIDLRGPGVPDSGFRIPRGLKPRATNTKAPKGAYRCFVSRFIVVEFLPPIRRTRHPQERQR